MISESDEEIKMQQKLAQLVGTFGNEIAVVHCTVESLIKEFPEAEMMHPQLIRVLKSTETMRQQLEATIRNLR